ncbi:dihydroxy-acid dehydratase [Loktanella sp. M215]|uniref:dihydroxy-acid dehydratase n=1 Tax=Loktanella sp. M215 TaxID=2675431 RepID=UPI001F1E3D54|nr:dihydroxy-acid dehydratase [Loktanella sp. M215]MCF7701307.1 dihydroxy-acid dehydratase [Loktanella sp. M215]
MRWGLPAALAMIAALAGCEPVSLTAPGEPSVRLVGDVLVGGPAGYCVDPVVTRPRQGFALLAACAAMTADETDTYPGDIALITVTVGDAGSAVVAGQEEDFKTFLETPQGAALLSASAIGGPVAVRQTQTDANAVAVYTEDVGPPGVKGTQTQAWRLFTDMRGRLVTISVRGLSEDPLSQSTSRALLTQMLAILRRANDETAT